MAQAMFGATPVRLPSAKEESGRNPGQGWCLRTLEGPKPKGASSGLGVNSAWFRQGLAKGSKPRNRRRRPVTTFGCYGARPTVCGPIGSETIRLPFAEEEASKGESQERCRCETKPARTKREKTVERVIKPCGRNVAGRQSPCDVDLFAPCAVGKQSPREESPPAMVATRFR
jgi:hypothetical protein